MKGEAAVAILASEGLAQVAVSCQHARRSFVPLSLLCCLNFSQFVGFQDSPNLSKIEKVTEMCELDGKEPLFVERTMAISNRVLGRKSTLSNFEKKRFFDWKKK